MEEKESLYNRKSWVPNDNLPQDKEEAVFYTCIKQGGKTADFLNFKLKSGSQKAVPVASIGEMEYLPDKGIIVLYCGFAEVVISGKNLEELYQKLLVLKVTEIREFSEPDVAFDFNQLMVSQIKIESTLANRQYH